MLQHPHAWRALVVGALLAALGVTAGLPGAPFALAVVAAATVARVVLADDPRRRDVAGGAAVAALAAGIALPRLDPAVAGCVAATAAQALLAWLGRERVGDAGRWSRRVLPVTGHVAVAAGSAVLLAPGGAGAETALLAYAGGLPVLALHAHWSMPRRERHDLQEVLLLVATAIAAIASTVAHLWAVAAEAAVAFAVVALAALPLALAAPPTRRPLLPSSGVAKALAHGAAALAILNVLFVAFALLATASARALVLLITLYIGFAVTMEYRAVRKARAAKGLFREPPPSWADEDPVTVLVAAKDEAATLAASLGRNLALPDRFRFLLVPSTASVDATVEVALAAEAAHPERVRVVLGTSGSKAGDLNLAWEHVETDLVLMLDADETTDVEGLRWGLAAMAASPAVAVVQGRKVSATPDRRWLNRFVLTERRHSTGLDQLFHAGLGSTHFAGSAALLRRDVVVELGGFTDRTLTEDIEFTLRLHLGTRRRIAYEPRMVVRESDPVDLEALVQQRTRWARGWTQCFNLYFGEVVARREALGRSRAFGLAWLLLMAVSAPVMALLPAFLVMRTLGIPALLPLALGLALASFVLPARLVGYAYSALHDPHVPVQRRASRIVETMLYAYVWIVAGWILSLHAFYLELSAAPREWYVTRKEVGARDPVPRSVPA